MFYGSGNSFQLLTNAWTWRITLKFKVASFLHIILPISASTPAIALANDLEIQGHVISARDLTNLSCYTCCSNEFDFVSIVLWVRWFIPTTAKCTALTDDLEIQGRMIFHVTLPLPFTTHAVATNLFLCLIFYVSGNSFQFPQNERPWQMTSKSKVTRFCTRLSLSQLL